MIDILRAEYETAIERKEKRAEGSYTCYLFDQGIDKILKKWVNWTSSKLETYRE